MWPGYFYKLRGRWTSPLYLLPRWLSSNDVGADLFTPIDLPPLSDFGGSITPGTPSGTGSIPADWFLTNSTPATGDLLSSIVESFVNETQYIKPQLLSAIYNRSFSFDFSSPETAWLVEVGFKEKIGKVEVIKHPNERVAIKQADSLLDLFYSGDWRWLQKDNCILITGLDLYQSTTEKREGDWHFISDSTVWSSGGLVWVEHPDTKNWIVLHPSEVRQDGFLKFHYEGDLQVRTRRPDAADALETFIVYVDDRELVATRTSLWNSVDEAGLYVGSCRRDKEENDEYGRSLIALEAFPKSSNKISLQGAISVFLREYRVESVEAGATGFSKLPSDTGYLVRRVPRVSYEVEFPQREGQYFRTKFADVSLGEFWIGNDVTPLTATATAGVFTSEGRKDEQDTAFFKWVVTRWNDSGDQTTFTDNMNHEDIEVLFTQKVTVSDPSLASLKLSFRKRDPSLRWRSVFSLREGEETGLAEFE